VELAPSPDAPTAVGRAKIRAAAYAAYKRIVRRRETLGSLFSSHPELSSPPPETLASVKFITAD
jgi:hypothetical protein